MHCTNETSIGVHYSGQQSGCLPEGLGRGGGGAGLGAGDRAAIALSSAPVKLRAAGTD